MKTHSPYIFIILTEGLRDFPQSHSRYSHLAKAWSQDQKNHGGIQIRKPFFLLIKGNASKISNEKADLEQTTMKENMTLMEASVPKETSLKWSIDQVSVSPIKPFKQRIASAEQSMQYNR